MSKGGKEGGVLSGQPNPSLPTDTYCTAAINHSPFGHQGERQTMTRQVSRGLQTKSVALFGLLAPPQCSALTLATHRGLETAPSQAAS